MVSITCYGGVNQIGGNQFLLEYYESRIRDPGVMIRRPTAGRTILLDQT